MFTPWRIFTCNIAYETFICLQRVSIKWRVFTRCPLSGGSSQYLQRVKRLFVYSAVTQFDTTNTSNGSALFGGAGSWVIRTGFLRIRRSPVRFPRCVLIIFRAGPRVLSSIECYKVAPIRDPGLDRGTNKQERFSNNIDI
jgi:hypothetical protein